ncbi:hypothetical protein [Alistipes sp. An66]|uniref:hypothetical protein n=1 Tax=Alistipes sp. An66 TaxID=1965650 RepID=UPI0011777807|nr:hypothetical protein [Alistipes sp. An66]
MKKLFTSLALCGCLVVSAQEKVRENVQDDYKRNSLSIIVVDRGDNYDDTVFEAVRSINLGDKFDLNLIPTNRITISGNRANTVGGIEVGKAVNASDLGKEILSYWFDRQADGTMNAKRLEQRGNYNADDQDVLNARAAKVGPESLGDTGYALVSGSYVMILDYSGITSSKNDKQEVSWSVTTNAYVYQIDYSQDIEAQVIEAWVYEDDTPEAIAQKNEAYDKILVGMSPKATVSYTTSAKEADGGVRAAIVEGYGETLLRLENQIPAWNVTTAIAKRNPLRAKIGTKEGVKNRMRFRAYLVKGDKNGNPYTVPKGYIRATTVADNRGMATGQSTKFTEFYQISGGKIDEGMTIKQKNDLGMGVSLGYKVGGLAPYNLTVDYLASINTKGFSHYGLLNIGYDMFSGSKIGDKVGKYLDAGDLTGLTDGGISYINFGIGYGFGIRPIRHVELMPFIMGGGDYMMNHNDFLKEDAGEETEDSFSKKIAWYGNAGLRVNFNVKYPLQLFIQADYTLLIEEGSYYKAFNDLLKVGDLGHKNSFGIMAGVKWTF